MARTISPEQHAARENEILDAAHLLIYRQGYAQMTIQDILSELGISKGAFYHYFGSKQAMLDALVARMVAQVMAVVRPIVDDEALLALPKLEGVFRAAAGWKEARREMLAALLPVWYADENALVREKQGRSAQLRLAGVFEAIIAQGVAEGVMHVDSPTTAATVIAGLLQSMSLEFGHCLMTWACEGDSLTRLVALAAAFTQAVERVLGVAEGALTLVDLSILPAWGEALAARGA